MYFWTSHPIVAEVGMERTSYNVTEGEGAMVEVCASVYSPDGSCRIQFPFNITGSTSSGTAGNYISRNHKRKIVDLRFRLQGLLRIMLRQLSLWSLIDVR